MTTKFRLPKDQAMGTVKWLWDLHWAEKMDEARSVLEDLPVSHTKQLTSFFHWMAMAGDDSLERSSRDVYEPSEGVS